MQGALFSRAELDAPWGIQSGQMTVGVFHAVVSGHCWLRVQGREPLELARGDVVYLPFGTDHVMSDAPAGPVCLRSEMRTTPQDDGMDLLEVDGAGRHTALLCGTVSTESSDVHPGFSLLPEIIHVSDADGGMASYVQSIIELLAREVRSDEPGSATAASRLTDVLVIYVLRHHIRQLGGDSTGWLAALRDPQLAAALGLIHKDPGSAWTATELARAVGMSRSAFFARFKDLVGETPTDYLTRWRMTPGESAPPRW